MKLRVAQFAEVEPFLRLLNGHSLSQEQTTSIPAQRAAVIRAQREGELLLAADADGLLGGVIVSARADPIWMDSPDANAAYISSLAIAADRRRRGVGSAVLTAAETLARGRGADCVRLACIASNKSLVRACQRRGYYPRGLTAAGGVLVLRHDRKLGGIERWSDAFVAERYATLMFIVRNGQVLLIRKKRGHGAGKINGPGGMVEAGESLLQCVLRETWEEVGVRVGRAAPLAELHFRDSDGSALLGVAFKARDWEGTPTETAEADPFWCPIAELPYQDMWEDDILWLPWLLDETPVIGDFWMDREQLLQHRLAPTDRTHLDQIAAKRR